MKAKIRAHDGIVGLLYGTSVLLTLQVGIEWVYLAGALAVLQIVGPFTKFCPVYFILNKLMPDTEPVQNGS
jgi:hypothetical protein